MYKFFKKLFYLYPMLMLFKEHRIGNINKIEHYLSYLPLEYKNSKIEVILITAKL